MSKELINQYLQVGNKITENQLKKLNNNQLKTYYNSRMIVPGFWFHDYEYKLMPNGIKDKIYDKMLNGIAIWNEFEIDFTEEGGITAIIESMWDSITKEQKYKTFIELSKNKDWLTTLDFIRYKIFDKMSKKEINDFRDFWLENFKSKLNTLKNTSAERLTF